MNRLVHLATLAITTAALALGTTAAPAQAGPAAGSQPAGSQTTDSQTTDSQTGGFQPAGNVYSITDDLARQLATAARPALFKAAAEQPVDLSTLRAGPALDRAIARANAAVLAAKGLPADGTSVLQLRLAHPDMRAALLRGEPPLLAAPPTDDAATAVTAYDHRGATVRLDATRLPQRPVLVVDVDTARALPAGLDVIRTTLAAHGITGATPRAGTNAGYWATKVTAVRLGDDAEPWVKGAAEIFGIASGFGLDGHVKVDTVTMPYLDHDGTTYFPNQLIVHFSAYRYDLADFVMMEDDGDTNYQGLAVALATALLTIVDGGAYIPLVNAILNAMPGSWWTDDPDYVDSWYTLATSSSGRLNGARANGWMDVVPHWVQQL